MEELHDIERHVMSLDKRLDAEEINILQYLKTHLQQFLNYYLRKTMEKIGVKELKTESIRIKKVIESVQKKLQNQPTRKSEFLDVVLDRPGVHETHKSLLATAERVKKNQVDVKDYDDILVKFVYWLDMINKSQWNNDIHDHYLYFGAILLQLFVNSPPRKATKVLDTTLLQLDHVSENLSKLNVENISPLESRRVKEEVAKLASVIENIGSLFTDKLDETKKKITAGNPHCQLDAMNHEVHKCLVDLENLHLPVETNLIKLLSDKLENMTHQIQSIPGQDMEISNKKIETTNNACAILKSIDDVKNINETLNMKAIQISEITGLHVTYEEKKVKLERIKKDIEEINVANKAVMAFKNEIIDKISAFIIAETAIYSRQKLKAIEDYKNYAQQFAFSKKIHTYAAKLQEIRAMKTCIEHIPEDNTFFTQRKKYINKQLEQVLETLMKRADENENIMTELEKLESIQNELSDTTLEREETLHVFNNYGEKIEAVKSLSSRIIAKKLEIFQHLLEFEKSFYQKNFVELHFLSTVDLLVKKYQTFTQQAGGLNLDQNFEENKQILSTEWQELEKTIRNEQGNVSTSLQVLKKFFQQLIEHLDKCTKDIKHLKSKMDQLLHDNVTDSEKTALLKELEHEINSFETDRTRVGFLKVLLPNIKMDILIEKSKIKFKSTVYNQIKDLKENVIVSNLPFIDKIVKLFTVKEEVEDVCGDIQELSTQKEAALKEIKHMIGKLDNQIAMCAFKTTPYENVLDVENYFTDLKFDGVQNKESVEFVKQIDSHAKNFEDSVKSYLGTRDSVDYYIIHENLMRLLEELDQLECDDDDLLKETIKTMDYITKLKKDLLANASFSS